MASSLAFSVNSFELGASQPMRIKNREKNVNFKILVLLFAVDVIHSLLCTLYAVDDVNVCCQNAFAHSQTLRQEHLQI